MDTVSYWIDIILLATIVYLYQRCYDKDEIIRNLKEKLSDYLN